MQTIDKVENELVAFDPKTPAVFGKSLVNALIQETVVREEIEEARRKVDAVYGEGGFLTVNLTNAILSLAKNDKNFDPMAYFDEAARRGGAEGGVMEQVMIHFGIKERHKIGANEIVVFAEDYAKFYDTSNLQADNPEYKQRRKAYNKLGSLLRNGIIAAAGMISATGMADPEALVITESDDGGKKVVMRNGPPEIMGGQKEVNFGGRKPVEGATEAANISGLGRIAKAKADALKSAVSPKQNDDKASAGNGGKGSEVTEQDLATMINNLTSAVNAAEGKLSDANVKRARNLVEALMGVEGVAHKEVLATWAKHR